VEEFTSLSDALELDGKLTGVVRTSADDASSCRPSSTALSVLDGRGPEAVNWINWMWLSSGAECVLVLEVGVGSGLLATVDFSGVCCSPALAACVVESGVESID
jgi:hypothetical protein